MKDQEKQPGTALFSNYAGRQPCTDKCGHGGTAGCLSGNYRPQHWPTGKNPPRGLILTPPSLRQQSSDDSALRWPVMHF